MKNMQIMCFKTTTTRYTSGVFLASLTAGGPCAPPPPGSPEGCWDLRGRLLQGLQERPRAQAGCHQKGHRFQNSASEPWGDSRPFSCHQPPNKILDSCMNLGSGRAPQITIQCPINLVSEGLGGRFSLTWNNVMFLVTELWRKMYSLGLSTYGLQWDMDYVSFSLWVTVLLPLHLPNTV